MVVALIHKHSASFSQADARSELATEEDVRGEYWWNLWKVRQRPFQSIVDGMPVLLLHSWSERPPGAVFSWLVEAAHVQAHKFGSKAEAIDAIAQWARMAGDRDASVRTIGNHPYSKARPADAGTAIFWKANPVRRLDVFVPPDLRVRQNGWLELHSDELASLGIRTTGTDQTGHPRWEWSYMFDAPLAAPRPMDR